MKLYIKQKVFSIGDKYDIYDAAQNSMYRANGEIFTLGSKIHLCNMYGEEVMFIKQKLLTFLPTFEIYTGEKLFAVMNKKFTFFYKKIEVSSTYGDFVIDGNFFDHDYSITCNGLLFGTVRKEWLSWGDVYELDINTEDHMEFFIAMVLAIDTILAQENRNH